MRVSSFSFVAGEVGALRMYWNLKDDSKKGLKLKINFKNEVFLLNKIFKVFTNHAA